MQKLKTLFLAIGGVLMCAAAAAAQTEKVVIYSDADFTGANMILERSWAGGGEFDRNIESVRVPAGFRVTLYTEKNYKGTETRLTKDWNPGGRAYWLNKARSIRIDRPAIQPVPPTKPEPKSFPVLYAGTNFNGAAEAVERDKTELADWDGSPHTIRSLRVPEGWFLVLYTRRNFRGKSYNVNSNMTFAPGDGWYNKIRSIKVYKGTPPKQPR